MSGSSSRKIAVIGGGISGLTAAWTLMRQSGCAVHLFEATNRLGGTLETHRIEEFLVEQSADMFTTDEPDALDLCSSLGIADQLINTNEADRRAFICWQGVLQPVPPGFAMMSPTDLDSIRETPLLSDAGKQRFLEEADIPPRADCDGEGVSITDESLQCFATRRFGVEAFERLIQPLIGGIYTADPEHLSMLATMKKYVEQERMYGSLIQAAKEAPTPADSATQGAGARYGRFVAPQGGMQALVDALANSLQAAGSQVEVSLNTNINSVNRTERGWRVSTSGKSDGSNTEVFDGVVIALPARRAAKLLTDVDRELASELNAIPYASSAVVLQGYRRSQFQHPLNGFGFVVPQVEGRKILACSFSSVKFSGRCPEDSVLIRTFVGGALQPELLKLSDEKIEQLVETELSEIMGKNGSPIFSRVVRWKNAMPQYHVGHLERVARIESRERAIATLTLAGNSLHGVGIPACIRSGRLAAERVAREIFA